MKVIDNLDETWLRQRSILTIGVFDGVHRGHQALVRRVVDVASERGLQSGVVTFYPHPDSVLFPQRSIRYITTPGEKAILVGRMQADLMVLIQFTPAIAHLSAGQFIERIAEHLRPQEIWVGQDFALGHDRQGDHQALAEIGQRLDFTVHAMEPVLWKGEVISSSRIRRLLSEGAMEDVAQLLGRYYSLAGEVVKGHQRGRLLGFPTANLEVHSERALPRDGVYACFAVLGDERFPAVANLGVRPTFDDVERLLEVHLLDMEMNLYGCDLNIEFVKWLRPELRFGSAQELMQQMQQDRVDARRALQATAPHGFSNPFRI